MLSWIELQIAVVAVVFWFEIEGEKVMKNVIGSQKFFIAWLDRA